MGGEKETKTRGVSFYEHMTEEGELYYTPTADGDSVWELPEGAVILRENPVAQQLSQLDKAEQVRDDWEKILDDESGSTYFYNSATGETSWEKPSDA